MIALGIIVAYLGVGVLAFRSILRRVVDAFPEQPIDGDTVGAAAFTAFVWPLGWPLFLLIWPSRKPRSWAGVRRWIGR